LTRGGQASASPTPCLFPGRKIGLEVSEEAKALLAERGFDPVYGARPLKRVIQRDVQNPLAMKILAGEFGEGGTVEIGVDKKGELAFKKA
jgi:ATP-dependent Clp protease ATP-binding subunit ClpB